MPWDSSWDHSRVGLLLVSFQSRDFSLVPTLEPHLKTVKFEGANTIV
jgi:hypothetical protein